VTASKTPPLSTIRRCGSALVAICFLWAGGCGHSDEQVKVKTAEVRTEADRQLAKLFLGGLVEKDYRGLQILMTKHAPVFNGAGNPGGRGDALGGFVEGWLKDHGAGGSGFRSFEFTGYGPHPSPTIDFEYTGEFLLSQPEGRVVHFRLQTAGYRVISLELSNTKLLLSALLRQDR
jgi:hypothetical protein